MKKTDNHPIGVDFFPYSKTETDYLTAQDPVLGAAIERIGHIRRRVYPDLFYALADSIVGQQISTKAHETIRGRLLALVGQVTPQSILSLSAEELQAIGITMKKAGYIRAAAEAVTVGRLDIEELRAMSDQEVCAALVALPGVGVWTAEMLMTFSLMRPDIMSYGDLGIRRGLQRLHLLETVDKKTFDTYRRLYSPYGTTASLYLWELSHGE